MLHQAQKEGNTEVYDQMKAALTAALEVKQVGQAPALRAALSSRGSVLGPVGRIPAQGNPMNSVWYYIVTTN